MRRTAAVGSISTPPNVLDGGPDRRGGAPRIPAPRARAAVARVVGAGARRPGAPPPAPAPAPRSHERARAVPARADPRGRTAAAVGRQRQAGLERGALVETADRLSA